MTTSVRQQGCGRPADGQQGGGRQGGRRQVGERPVGGQQTGGWPAVGGQQETCCSTLVPTPMYHKGLLGWKYDSRCNYMVTLVTEPRASVFGVLREWGVERSKEGRAVYDAWQEVEARFPGVRATYNAIMPDHFHGIVYITVEGRVNLGEVVAFFAAEAERRIGRRVWCGLWRDSVCIARGQLDRQIKYILANPKRRWIVENNPGLFRKVMGFRHWRLERANETLGAVADADSWDFRSFARDGGGCEFWDMLTGEEIAKPRKGNQLQRAFEEQQAYDNKQGQQAYDNKGGQQAHDDKGAGYCYSTPVVSSRRVEWTSVGNPFLLDAPLLVSVRISQATPPDVLAGLVAKLGAKAERGAVLVSPWISPGEKAVKAEALACGGRVVQLLADGMGRYYKPQGGDFDACSEGRMLQLSPFAPQPGGGERRSHGKARFEWLNRAARAMGDLAAGISRAQLAEMAAGARPGRLQRQGGEI